MHSGTDLTCNKENPQNPQIIVSIKWQVRVTQIVAVRERARAAVAYLTIQIAATLRFGARDKVTAQIVISVTSAHDLRETFARCLRDNAARYRRWRPIARRGARAPFASAIAPRHAASRISRVRLPHRVLLDPEQISLKNICYFIGTRI